MSQTAQKVIISAEVDRQVRDELAQRAAASDHSLSAEIRRALAKYLGEPSKRRRATCE